MFPAVWETGLDTGNVSLVVQSGVLSAGFLIDIMTNGIMGISKACSIGNKACVDECDILEYLIEDADSMVIGLYLESIFKHQIANKSQIPIFNDQNRFGIWDLDHCNLFEICDLFFEIYRFSKNLVGNKEANSCKLK
jgi:hypothetical protein